MFLMLLIVETIAEDSRVLKKSLLLKFTVIIIIISQVKITEQNARIIKHFYAFYRAA